MKAAFEKASSTSTLKPEWLEEWKKLEEEAMNERGESLRIFMVNAKPGLSFICESGRTSFLNIMVL